MNKLLITMLSIVTLTACNSGGRQGYNNHPSNSTLSVTSYTPLSQPIPNVPGFESDSNLCQAKRTSMGNAKNFIFWLVQL